jgi:hypothetical protein
MLDWLRRNARRVAYAIVAGLVAVFGSLRDASGYFLSLLHLESAVQLTSFQFLFIGISLGIFVLVGWDALRASRRFSKMDSFDAHVNKPQFKLGETVFIEVTFKGQLRNGFYFAYVIRPDRHELSLWDEQTYSHPRIEQWGNMHGKIDHKGHGWSRSIPLDYPTGEYSAYVRVHDVYPRDWWTRFRAWYLRNFTEKDRKLIAIPDRPCIAEKSISFNVRS